MQPLRRVHAVGAVSMAIVVIALVALVAPIAREPTVERLGSSPPASRPSIVDTADLVESAAVDTASGRAWHRLREPALGLGIAAALCAAVAAAALCFLSRSARDRVRSRTVTANGMRAPPRLHALS